MAFDPVNHKFVLEDNSLNPAQYVETVPNVWATLNATNSSNISGMQSTISSIQSGYVPNTRTVAGKPLSSNVSLSASDVGAAATSHTHAASDITSGTMATARLGSGTASSSVFLRGDGTWSSPVSAPSYTNNASRSIVTTAAAANGWQLSGTRDARASYSVTINTTVSLTGNATGYVVMEIAATNSSTAGDWQEVARVASGQSGTLVVGLVLNQVGGGCLSADVPAGYYVRLRSVNTNGTPTYTYNSGQEKLI